PKNDFERKALDDLSAHPEKKEFYQIDDGLLQYGRAVIMKPTCVACHNTRSDSPKKDWQVGDVRGVFSITQNLDNFTGETNKSIQITSFMLGGLSLLGISGISLVMGRLRQTANELEVRV
ncbi:Tll0287-like domain-containing protein, partial [Nostoc sp.]